MESKHMTVIAWGVAAAGFIAGIVAGNKIPLMSVEAAISRFSSPKIEASFNAPVMLSIWAATFFVVVLFLFCAAVLYRLEILTYKAAGDPKGSAGNFPSSIELTVPVTPTKNEMERNRVIEDIKSSGFKSTMKHKYKNYLVAIDENRKEWVVVTPDGQNSVVYPFNKFQGCKMIVDENKGYCAGVEVRINIKGQPTDSIHIILMDRTGGAVNNYGHLKDEAEKICLLLNKIIGDAS